MSSSTINSQIVGGATLGQEKLRAGESVVAYTPANRRQFGILYGGRLVLTDQRLVFLPGISVIQRRNVSLDRDSIASLREKRMRFALLLGARFALPIFNVPAVVLETTTRQTYEFELGEIRTGDRARWIEMLTNAITRPTNGGS